MLCPVGTWKSARVQTTPDSPSPPSALSPSSACGSGSRRPPAPACCAQRALRRLRLRERRDDVGHGGRRRGVFIALQAPVDLRGSLVESAREAGVLEAPRDLLR